MALSMMVINTANPQIEINSTHAIVPIEILLDESDYGSADHGTSIHLGYFLFFNKNVFGEAAFPQPRLSPWQKVVPI